jgi:hypothetical protein
MTSPQTVELAPDQAIAMIREELAQAARLLQTGRLDAALDRYTAALGLGLQLGPGPTQEVLTAILDTARALARKQEAHGLSALGPALVALVDQVRDAGVLPATAVMDAWAIIAADLATLIGQLGVALEIAPDRRGDMMDNARLRASLLDNATIGLFGLVAWLDDLGSDGPEARRP